MVNRYRVNTKDAPAAIGPYSQAIVVDPCFRIVATVLPVRVMVTR